MSDDSRLGYLEASVEQQTANFERLYQQTVHIDHEVRSLGLRLDTKIDDVALRLEQKIDSVAGGLEQKIDSVAGGVGAENDGVGGGGGERTSRVWRCDWIGRSMVSTANSTESSMICGSSCRSNSAGQSG